MNSLVVDETNFILIEYNDKYYFETYNLFSKYRGKELIRYAENFFHRLYFNTEFNKKLKQNYYNFFLLKEKNGNKILGFIYCYDIDSENKNAFFDIYIPDHQYYKEIVELVDIYLRKVRTDEKIRVVYSHCLGNDSEKLYFLQRCNFNNIGIMKKYRFYNGEYLDMNILELS